MKAIDPKNPTQKVLKWIARLKRTLDAAPDGLWIYVASGSCCIMATDGNGDSVVHDPMVHGGGGIDQSYMIDSITNPKPIMDGGDW